MRKKILSVVTACAMLGALGVGAFAAPVAQDKELPGQGYIAKAGEGDEGPDDMIDIDVPENGFFWYANEDTQQTGTPAYFDIKSDEYVIKNNSETIELSVELEAYQLSTAAGALSEIESNSLVDETEVIVDLTVDGVTVAQNIVNNTLTAQTLRSTNHTNGLLGADSLKATASNELKYTFSGEYQNTTLPSDHQTSDYVLVMTFEAVHSVGV